MTIVLGRGNKRVALVLPCAAIFKRVPEQEQNKAVADLCQLAGIKAESV